MRSAAAKEDAGIDAPNDGTDGLRKATWSYIIPTFREPTPEEQAEGKTCDDKVIIEVPADQLEGYFRAQGHRGLSEQVQAVLDRQLGGVAQKLEAMANESGSGANPNGAAFSLGDALARELVQGIARQPHLVTPIRSVLQGPVEPASNTNALLMKRAAYAERIAVSVRKLDDLIKQGLPTVGKGRMIRVQVAEADRWVQEHLDDAGDNEDEIEQLANAGADRLAQGAGG